MKMVPICGFFLGKRASRISRLRFIHFPGQKLATNARAEKTVSVLDSLLGLRLGEKGETYKEISPPCFNGPQFGTSEYFLLDAFLTGFE
jgi:hypothetical protein